MHDDESIDHERGSRTPVDHRSRRIHCAADIAGGRRTGQRQRQTKASHPVEIDCGIARLARRNHQSGGAQCQREKAEINVQSDRGARGGFIGGIPLVHSHNRIISIRKIQSGDRIRLTGNRRRVPLGLQGHREALPVHVKNNCARGSRSGAWPPAHGGG